MRTDEPLGLPPGSVRAIIALALTGVAGWLMVTNTPVPENLWIANFSAWSLYFGSRIGAES